MRSFSFFSILLLCLAILIIDIIAFYWLQSIMDQAVSPMIKTIINILFWVFTAGLIISIIILKISLDDINPLRKHLWISSFYGLTVSSLVPKFVFVIVISILYFLNYMFSESESLIIVPLVGILSGFLPFFIITYGIFKSAYRFKVYRHMISYDHLPASFNGLRLVQLSDIHLGNFNYRYRLLEKAVEKVNHLKPDYIVFTGDLVNNFAWELRGWQKVFSKLEAKKGKYAVLGNHDYGDYSQWESEKGKNENFETIKQFFKDIDFKLLLNETDVITENEESISIIGVENWGRSRFKRYGDLQKSMKGTEAIPFKILLSHDPSHWSDEVLTNTNIALTLSGHTHGMQAGIRYKNLQWSPIKYKYEHWAGLYEHQGQFLHVNRGLGWIGFPGRLGMRPEITFIELRRN